MVSFVEIRSADKEHVIGYDIRKAKVHKRLGALYPNKQKGRWELAASNIWFSDAEAEDLRAMADKMEELDKGYPENAY